MAQTPDQFPSYKGSTGTELLKLHLESLNVFKHGLKYNLSDLIDFFSLHSCLSISFADLIFQLNCFYVRKHLIRKWFSLEGGNFMLFCANVSLSHYTVGKINLL